MIYAFRRITKREPINKYGRLGFVPYIQYFKTDKQAFFDQQNKGKRVKFEKVSRDAKFLHIDKNRIYEEREE